MAGFYADFLHETTIASGAITWNFDYLDGGGKRSLRP
mgnify:FL=1